MTPARLSMEMTWFSSLCNCLALVMGDRCDSASVGRPTVRACLIDVSASDECELHLLCSFSGVCLHACMFLSRLSAALPAQVFKHMHLGGGGGGGGVCVHTYTHTLQQQLAGSAGTCRSVTVCLTAPPY